MPESVASDTFNALNRVKTNATGNISIKNGKVYNDGESRYTTIGDPGGPTNEAIRDQDSLSLTQAKNFNGTADLTVSNGNLRATGYGSITLI
jgi:hypothetical protein